MKVIIYNGCLLEFYCLQEIDEYETKGGKIIANAKKALKFFGMEKIISDF